MESNEPRFKHVGLSSDGTVVFCDMDNGKTYSMPLLALERAEEWDPKAKPEAVMIIHDGYAALVQFNTGVKIDFASDFVLHLCEPTYAYYKDKGRTVWSIGGRIREIREWRGMSLEALAAKCGIAKPNLSRLENDNVTPTFETLRKIAAALETHPALLVQRDAWIWTQQAFVEWQLGLRCKAGVRNPPVWVRALDLVNTFLASRPEHRYARLELLRKTDPTGSDLAICSLDAEKWAREEAAAAATEARLRRSKRA